MTQIIIGRSVYQFRVLKGRLSVNGLDGDSHTDIHAKQIDVVHQEDPSRMADVIAQALCVACRAELGPAKGIPILTPNWLNDEACA